MYRKLANGRQLTARKKICHLDLENLNTILTESEILAKQLGAFKKALKSCKP